MIQPFNCIPKRAMVLCSRTSSLPYVHQHKSAKYITSQCMTVPGKASGPRLHRPVAERGLLLVQQWYQQTVKGIYTYYGDMATYFWNNQFRADVKTAINGEHLIKPHSMQCRTCSADLPSTCLCLHRV